MPKARLAASILFLLSAVLATALCAQSYGDDDSDDNTPKTASLWLTIGREGATHFNLTGSNAISGREDLSNFLSSAWACTLDGKDRFTVPESFHVSKKHRAELQAAWERSAERSVSGKCVGTFRRRGLSLQGDFDLQSIADILRRDGIEILHLTIALPDTHIKSIEAPVPLKTRAVYGASTYDVPLQAPIKPFHVQLGYSRSDVLRVAIVTALFMIVPIAVVLVMRSTALRRGAEDPSGAWFSFMKAMQFSVNAAFLLWNLTHLNTRAQLSELLEFAGWNHGWRSVAGQLAVITVPTWTVYLVCTSLSYKVFLRIRSVSWTWNQFMTRQLVQLGRVFFPLTFYLAGMMTLGSSTTAAVALFALGWISYMVCLRLHQKLEKSYPSAVTSGPLRDRIFAMAQNMGVKVRQVFVIPAAQSGVANAFATKNETIAFTDYLIAKLNQREVDAIAAHELTHLRHKHAPKLGWMLLGVMFLPGWILGFARGLIQTALILTPASLDVQLLVERTLASEWTQAAFMVLLFWLFYFIQKRFEYAADAGAVNATRDPEAMITALVKISHLNMTPLQWSRSSEAMLTHPSTRRRVESIARQSGLPEGQLEILIEQAHNDDQQDSTVTSPYVVTPNTTGVVSMARSSGRAQRNLLILIVLHILPPTAIFFCLHRLLPLTGINFWLPAAGIVISLAIYHLGSMLLTISSNRHLAKAVRKSFGADTAPYRAEESTPVGFAPGPSPRFFVTGYNWDHGLLIFAADKIVFKGTHASFALRRDQVRSVLLARGAPSWNNWQRVYFSWEDKETGKSGTFNFLPLEHQRLLQLDARALYLRVRSWRNMQQQQTAPSESANAPGIPDFGTVTSTSPKQMNRLSRTSSLTAVMIFLGFAASAALKMGAAGLGIGVTIVLIRIFESIPYWLYRERPVVYDAASAPVMIRPAARGQLPAPVSALQLPKQRDHANEEPLMVN